MQEARIGSPSQEYPLEKGWQPTIPDWEIPWTEEPGGLQFMGSQRVGFNRVWTTFTCSSRVVCLGEAGTGAGGKMQEAGEGTREVPFLSCGIGVLILDSLRGLTEMPWGFNPLGWHFVDLNFSRGWKWKILHFLPTTPALSPLNKGGQGTGSPQEG